MSYEGLRLLLGVSSSIAAYRALDIASTIVKGGGAVQVVMTADATHVVGPKAFDAITGRRTITSLWDASQAGEMDHLAATKWANVFCVAPATANTLAHLAVGLADDALGTLAVAWPGPLVVAPAMNPTMYEHPTVRANVATLVARGHAIVEPAVGPAACGDFGRGRLADVTDILLAVVDQYRRALCTPDLRGEHVVVTSGPTREFADPVRCITNPSTGKMGIAVARAARDCGARVTLVLGPTSEPAPEGLHALERVVTAEDMRDAVLRHLPEATVLVFAAAVSDWRPAEVAAQKAKKEGAGEEMTLRLVRTPDVAAAAGEARLPGQTFVGFAAETQEVAANAREKLLRKGFDFVVANDVTEPGSGFGTETNRASFVSATGVRSLPLLSKDALAREILAEVARLRRG